ncbi:KANK [Mytilus coruscus]|uniref:KANK n=1 Tax=Mytilus coruscus TaxID=42192 RepID=A0A6J8AKQ5_MYTCO|nr:KANK [Mytilus coruscus]
MGGLTIQAKKRCLILTDLKFDHQNDRYVEKDAFTVLHYAISHENIDVVRIIIDQDVSALQYKTRSGFSALQLAITKNNVGIFELCAKHLKIENEDNLLLFSVRTGDFLAANIILAYNIVTLECTDFQGLTPIASSVVFHQPRLFKKLLLSGAKTSFNCKPSEVKKRINTMRGLNIYDFFYTELPHLKTDEHCTKGSSLGHLLTFNPSCMILSSLMDTKNLMNILTEQNHEKRTPLYNLLCIDKFGVSPARLSMLIFTIGLQDRKINRIKLLEDTGVCGFKVQFKLHIDKSFKFPSTCTESYKTFPRLEEIYIKHKSTMYNKNNISMLLPLKKKSVLMIYTKSPDKKTEYLFSINVTM